MAAERSPRLSAHAVLAMRLAFLTAFVCSAFSAAASAFLLLFVRVPELQLRELTAGLILRLGLFLVLAAASLFGVLKLPLPALPAEPLPEVPVSKRWRGTGLLIVLAFAAVLLVPGLDDYPWAAPDEMHHLIVAKNLAFVGEYASGSPSAGLRRFDPFDSVGPPAIVPAALAFRCFGLGLSQARCVTAAYFLGLCALLYLLAKPVFGPRAAVLGAAFVPMAFSSIYLGRTLYGEVPALFYLVLALLLWRRAMGERPILFGLFAGCAFAIAVLTKSILLLALFPLLGACLHDRLTERRIGARHLLMPFLGAAGILLAWSALKHLFGGGVQEGIGATLGLYQHYLLFGFEPVAANLRASIGAYPFAHAMLLIALLTAILARRHDPAMLTLTLLALFFAFWWIFFTPGQLPRYLWFSYAILALYSGALLGLMESWLAYGRRFRRVLAAILILATVSPYAAWTLGQARELRVNKEMRDDRALAGFVQHLPANAKIATSFYPLQKTIAFFTGREIERGEDPFDLLQAFDVVLARTAEALPTVTPAPFARLFIGRYTVYVKSDMLSPQSATTTQEPGRP